MRTLYERPEFLEKSEIKNEAALTSRKGPMNILKERPDPVPGKTNRKKRSRVKGSFIAEIGREIPTLEQVTEEVFRAKERSFVRALEESGFRETAETGNSGSYKWKIAMRASTSYKVVLVLDENQVWKFRTWK